ncbi:polysaccharide export outer membrane protein [Paraburkholderia unamae]|uniref:polysaccharide biosynthesis/export family protein n=2 Tax=Paraburkholderia unamae TaxID=219649 RepID=UPI000DC4699B|nr:polysaccharide export outer membrane protein [Paraburkholderia unamae]
MQPRVAGAALRRLFELRSRVYRVVLLFSAPVAMSACMYAPGMKMQQASSLPVESASQGTPEARLPVPMTDITMSLISRMRSDAVRETGVEAGSLFDKARPYAIGPGDVLQITVWDHPELAAALGAQPPADSRTYDPPPGFVVDNAGRLNFPFAGSILVQGLRVDELQSKLASALGKSFHNPQVTVRIASFRSQQVYVDGDVHTPGAQAINDIPTTLYDAIGHAGGFATTADQSAIELVRNGKSFRINMTQMLDGGHNPAKIVLRGGDFVRVSAREDNGVYVMGEVTKPTKALPLRNGVLTLSDALSQAGSISSTTADAAQLYVIRGTGKDAEVFHLDASSPVSMVLANQFTLDPKDVVYVDGNGLVRFSRVLSLLLPAIDAGLTAGLVAK